MRSKSRQERGDCSIRHLTMLLVYIPRWLPLENTPGARLASPYYDWALIHIITHPRACGKPPGRVQTSRTFLNRICDDRTCGGDSRRRSDRADVGGRI